MQWLAVAIGGALGAMSRYGLNLWFATAATSGANFPWATLTANIAGSMLIGIAYVLIVDKGIVAEAWRPLLMVGFLGALTTFSTFALDALLLWQQQQWYYALIYLFLSVFGCLAGAAGSIWFANKLF